jgi:hypothetical protein
MIIIVTIIVVVRSAAHHFRCGVSPRAPVKIVSRTLTAAAAAVAEAAVTPAETITFFRTNICSRPPSLLLVFAIIVIAGRPSDV